MNKIKQFLSSRAGAYLLLILALFLTQEIMASFMDWEGCNGLFTQFRRLADAALMALPALLLNKKWFTIPWIVIVNIYHLSNIWYYRNYGTFIPLTSLFLFGNLRGLGDSILASMQWKDILIPLPSLFWIAYTLSHRKKKQTSSNIWTTIIIIFYCTAITSINYIPKDSELRNNKVFLSNFSKGFKKYGFINYWIGQTHYLGQCSNSEIQMVSDCLSEMNLSTPVVQESLPQKNLIILVVESLSSWEIGLTPNNFPVTPNINRLINDSSTIYIPNCLTQVKDGRSSDCHLMINTGLLPMAIGAASNQTWENRFYTLPLALKNNNHLTQYFVCDDKKHGSWFQGANYNNYGYDQVHDLLGQWKDHNHDQQLFSNTFSILKHNQQPFLAVIVTLTMHESSPLPCHTTPLLQLNDKDEYLRHFLNRTHNTDYHLGVFLDSLRSCGLYDNSIIVITGDHFKFGLNIWEGRPHPELSDLFVPLIILNSPIRPERTDMVIGQIDIYPTLLDLMGVGDYVWRGLGESIFTPGGHSGCAVYHTGEAIGDTSNVSILAHKRSLWRISDIILRSDYFSKHPLK